MGYNLLDEIVANRYQFGNHFPFKRLPDDYKMHAGVKKLILD
jgi:hypothetical protein